VCEANKQQQTRNNSSKVNSKMLKFLYKRNIFLIATRSIPTRAASTSTIFFKVDEFGRQNPTVAAIFDEFGRHSYGDVATKSDNVAKALRDEKIVDENVSYLCPNNASYAFATFGIW
jgi:hypothetical protein